MSRLLRIVAPCFSVVLVFAHTAQTRETVSEDPPSADLQIETLAGPFEFPWSIGFLPGGRILVTEKPGRLNLIEADGSMSALRGVPRVTSGQHAGLLDVAVSPDFERTRTLYLSYTRRLNAGLRLEVLRAHLDLDRRRLTRKSIIFRSMPFRTREQLGGRLALTDDGHLLFSTGDRWTPEVAQDLTHDGGKIIRLALDGSAPDTNPFFANPGAAPQVWSYGHRNPQGMVIDQQTRALWATEHGPLGGDELNLIRAGRNYGWPVVTHGLAYSGEPMGIGKQSPGFEKPVYVWRETIAPSGLALSREQDRVFLWVGSLAGRLIKLEIAEGEIVSERRVIDGELGRIRDVRIGPDGAIYLLTDDSEGMLYKATEQVETARAGESLWK